MDLDVNGGMTAGSTDIQSRALFDLFDQYAARPFVFVRPGGNAGDELIYFGAEKLARNAGLTYTTIRHEDFVQKEYDQNTVIYLHGSGGFNPIWSGKPMDSLKHASRHRGVVIQGPSTFWDDLAFMKDRVAPSVHAAICERLVLMARERVSYDILLEALPSDTEILLDHDTALNLKREDIGAMVQLRTGSYKLYGIRDDKEERAAQSREYFALWLDPVTHGGSFEGWAELHTGASELITNRLHSSILGSILGIPTTLLPNSYFKNRAVWEHSLKHRGVRWMDSLGVSAPSQVIHQFGPARRLMRRKRVQRLVARLHGINPR